MKHFISLGAGVQSSTMALMAAHGEIEPMPDGAIFADTQAEPKAVYEWLDWLEKRLPFPVHRVTKGRLRDDVMNIRTRKDGSKYLATSIPFFQMKPNGDVGRSKHRDCTADYKVAPIRKALRKLGKVPRSPDQKYVCQWIGVSLDEFKRMKPSQDNWIETRWPLIEKRMTRHLCLEWMRSHGYPEPPRSACTFCPFHSNDEWRRIAKTDIDGYADAVALDAEARILQSSLQTISEIPFLHRSLKPLPEVDFRNDVDRGQMTFGWDDECTGMCGV